MAGAGDYVEDGREIFDEEIEQPKNVKKQLFDSAQIHEVTQCDTFCWFYVVAQFVAILMKC